MRTLLVGLGLAAALAAPALAGDHYVSGYVRSDGTYVAPHYQTNPNNTINDNYSTRPNVNPYTGQEGTRQPTFDSQPYELPTYAPAYPNPPLGGGIRNQPAVQQPRTRSPGSFF